MITKEIALTLHHGQTLYHKTIRNRDGSAIRARVNGKVKTWKRKPNDFRIPMKRGLRECFYILSHGQFNWSAGEWSTVDPLILKECASVANLDPNTPWQIVYDNLVEKGSTVRTKELLEWVREYLPDEAILVGQD